jgi:recombination protein RecR
VDRLADALAKLPGIGRKTALRLAFSLVDDGKLSEELAEVLSETARNVHECPLCRNLTLDPVCDVCGNGSRARSICVVHTPADMRSIEETGLFRGTYFVLHGSLAPLDGVGPGELGIPALLDRVAGVQAQEVILALDSTTEGEATCAYIARALEGLGVPVTRLARGLPPGALVEYADALTLSQALKGRSRV